MATPSVSSSARRKSVRYEYESKLFFHARRSLPRYLATTFYLVCEILFCMSCLVSLALSFLLWVMSCHVMSCVCVCACVYMCVCVCVCVCAWCCVIHTRVAATV